jgi:hypothetical protein
MNSKKKFFKIDMAIYSFTEASRSLTINFKYDGFSILSLSAGHLIHHKYALKNYILLEGIMLKMSIDHKQ